VSQGEVIVAHPAAQHSYETALAVQEAGLLKRYITGIYYKPESAVGQAVHLVQAAERQFRKRHKHGLSESLVKQYPLGETVYLTGARLKPLARHAARIVRWRNRRFDRIVARVIERERPAALICYDTCGLRAFTKAKSVGTLRILDQSVGHWRTLAELLREEAERHPDFADTLLLDTPEEFLAQCTEEALMADRILAGSQYVKDTMIRHGVEASRISIIPYGADIDRFMPARRPKDVVFRLLFVGQLSQRKGIKYLLEAVRQLAAPDLELRLVGGIVGSGLGLAPYRDYFTHIGNVPHYELHQHFQQADVFVYPSLHEGSAIAIYEALAAGLPVITTPNSGSVVRDGVEGFIVPIRDVDALKEKILLLSKDTDLREEMCRNARKRSEEFTWVAYRQRIASALYDLLSRPAPHLEAASAAKRSAYIGQ
jgi:alpha-maltose-1-phosphate synthase